MLWHRQRDPVQLVVQENRVVPTTSSRRAGAGGKGATVRAGRISQCKPAQFPSTPLKFFSGFSLPTRYRVKTEGPAWSGPGPLRVQTLCIVLLSPSWGQFGLPGFLTFYSCHPASYHRVFAHAVSFTWKNLP